MHGGDGLRRPRRGGRAGALPETCGDAARYADPHDPDDIATQVEARSATTGCAKRARAGGPVHLGAHGAELDALLSAA